MFDAMCFDCRFLWAVIFGRKPGWKCLMDIVDGMEHDPTDQVCDAFERKPDSASPNPEDKT
jgi:hypothetical protein